MNGSRIFPRGGELTTVRACVYNKNGTKNEWEQMRAIRGRMANGLVFLLGAYLIVCVDGTGQFRYAPAGGRLFGRGEAGGENTATCQRCLLAPCDRRIPRVEFRIGEPAVHPDRLACCRDAFCRRDACRTPCHRAPQRPLNECCPLTEKCVAPWQEPAPKSRGFLHIALPVCISYLCNGTNLKIILDKHAFAWYPI